MLFAGVPTVYGQATQGSAPRDLTEDCDGDALSPRAGIPYTYGAGITPDGGNSYWYATFSRDFIVNGVRPVDIEEIPGAAGSAVAEGDNEPTNYMNTDVGNPKNTEITWTTSGLAQVDDDNPLFVVIEYTAGGDDCSNNIKVYQIDPIMPFQVNVLALGDEDPDYGQPQLSCFSDVWDARYDMEEEGMVYDYGTNTLTFEVVAAYFDSEYDASFRIEGLEAGQTADVYWSYTNDFDTAGDPIEEGVGNGSFGVGTIETDAEDTSDGVSIYVWVIVHNNTWEGTENLDITFAAAGTTTDDDLPNVWWEDCGVELSIDNDIGDFEDGGPDYAIHTLQARPEINPDPDLEFIPPVD